MPISVISLSRLSALNGLEKIFDFRKRTMLSRIGRLSPVKNTTYSKWKSYLSALQNGLGRL